MKKRILFVGDLDNWAMHHIYQYMQKEMNTHYTFTYCSISTFKKFKWPLLILYNNVYISYALMLKWVKVSRIFKHKILTGVHCHWEFCDRSSLESAVRTAETVAPEYLHLLNQACRIAAVSATLYAVLKKYSDNIYYVPYAIDPEIFYPEPGKQMDEFFHVGWAQSETNHDFKRRINEIECVCRELPWVKLDKIGDNRTRLITFDSIRHWYNSLDCYVCFSIFEGGPLPVLEAMACGIPCISTPVGQVPEIIISGHNGFIVEKKEELKEKIVLLKDNRKLREKISINARKSMLEKRTPQIIGKYWKSFFE